MAVENFFDALAHRWPTGRRDLHWLALFNAQDVQRQLTRPYRGLTHRPGLEPVKASWVHMTVLHAGPEDDATPVEVEQIAEQVRERCAALVPFDVVFGRPAVGQVAVECLGRPGAPGRRLWEITREATSEVVRGRWDLRPRTFYPHIALAYAGEGAEQVDRQAMKAWLSDHDGGEAVRLRVERLSLVAEWHDRKEIKWNHLTDVPLGSAR